MAFADNIWWTRKARIEAEKRLLSMAFQSQALLLWYSICSVLASIYYLRFAASSEYITVAWLTISVLVLAISGFVSTLRFKERAGLIKECYETLQVLYEKLLTDKISEQEATEEYRTILAVCENHKNQDFYAALCNTQMENTSPDKSEHVLTRTPNNYIWYVFVLHRIRAFLVYLVLYSLPVAVFLSAEIFNVFS